MALKSKISKKAIASFKDVVAGKLDPSPVIDLTVELDGVPSGYTAMDSREAIKVMVRP